MDNDIYLGVSFIVWRQFLREYGKTAEAYPYRQFLEEITEILSEFTPPMMGEMEKVDPYVYVLEG